MDIEIDLDKLASMKYAQLRTLAKTVGIKANMKADKLLKALREYAATQSIDTGRLQKTEAKSTPATQKSGTPKIHTPVRRPVLKAATPLSAIRTKAGTPLSAVRTKSGTPLSAVRTKPGTPLSAVRTKPGTPLSAPRSRPSTPKVRTPLQRLRTPPASSSGGKARRSGALLTPSGGDQKPPASRKRSRSASFTITPAGEETRSAKKQRIEVPATQSEDAAPRRRRSRSNTYDLDESKLSNPAPAGSPGTTELLQSMQESETEQERKDKLMAALDKKVQEKMDGKQGTQIPRFVAFCALKKQEENNAKNTPGQQRWKKVHAKNFEKMDSLDQYLEKKKKRTELLTGSAQKARHLAEQTSSALKKLKSMTGGSLSTKKGDAKSQLFKTPAHSGVPFVPKVTSVNKVNFDFSASLKSPMSGVRPVKTPGSRVNVTKTPGSGVKVQRKSPRLGPSMKENEPKEKLKDIREKSMGSAITPFKFTATLNQSHNKSGLNMSLNKSAHKSKFDLGASLARPMTWKPHTGKLKPFTAGTTSVHQRDVKAVKVTTKEERRQQAKANQTQKRRGAQMTRRGLAA